MPNLKILFTLRSSLSSFIPSITLGDLGLDIFLMFLWIVFIDSKITLNKFLYLNIIISNNK